MTRHWQTTQPLFFEPAAAEALCPAAVSEDLAFVSDVFAAFAELPAAVAEEAALLALDDAFVSDDFAASFEAAASGLRWLLLTPSWSRRMQKWLLIVVTLPHSFLTFSPHRHW
ncbi:hypothetical protein KZ779_01985 [Escherichia coli]|nr:hypothetical protein [Escherichia coli]